MKIEPVNKLCTACWGIGEIEKIPHAEPKPDDRDKGKTMKCYICNGNGYIPTGEFIVLAAHITKPTLIEAILSLPSSVYRAITKRK